MLPIQLASQASGGPSRCRTQLRAIFQGSPQQSGGLFPDRLVSFGDGGPVTDDEII